MCQENLTKLRELTEELIAFPPMTNDSAGFEVIKGKCLSWFLWQHEDIIKINDFWMAEGTDFPAHQHAEEEYAIVYKGKAIFKKEGKEIIMTEGVYVHTPARVLHSASFPEECRVVVISMPPTEEYPNART